MHRCVRAKMARVMTGTADTRPPAGRQEDEGRLRVRVLVIALVGQFVLAAVVLYFAATGWPMFGGPPSGGKAAAVGSVPARFLPGAPGDGVPTPRTDRFDAARAYALVRRQVGYGLRPAGSPALRRLAADLRRRMPGARYEPVGGHPGLRNVVAVVPGRRPAIVVGAHYDTVDAPPGFVGANDGAAGTAIVAELLRALRASRAPVNAREVRFVLFDGEEAPSGSASFLEGGLRGSRAYVDAHRREVRSMVLLDYVGARGLRLPREGTSDPALWARLRSAARRTGTLAAFPAAAGELIYDDHTPFVDAQIPAIDLIDWDYPWQHVPEDALDKISRRSLDVTGETVLALLLAERRR
ncbi:unannotated protein [freshwater metagenome]|uniref:Unannotated protein n=1 Tax=freshwater metagenome TaxID=449393 RepID=A0A6J7IRF3_9ZZZZ|nr:M20/M25/M40 family metallo-hydrolase [Actinomycetota bacterium]